MKFTKIRIFGVAAAIFYAFSSPALAGSITGKVVYEGQVPQFKEIKMEADPVCLTHHTAAVYPDTLVLGEGQTMGNVYIRVTSGFPQKKYDVPADSAVLNQKGCTYDPHVMVARVGQPVKILNPDGTLHNVHALPKVNPEFNLAMPKFRTELTKTFDKAEPEMFPIKCDVHPWMGAWVAVLDHPFYAVTAKDGKFTIEGLEPGTYEVQAWHEKLGIKTASVTIDETGTGEANFTFSRP